MERGLLTPRTVLAATSAAVIALLGASACSAETSTAEPPCDEASIRQALEASLSAADSDLDGTLVSIDGFQCADGWAVAFPTLDGFAGDVAVTTTAVLKAQDQEWAVVPSRIAVCGTYGPTGDPMNPTYPDDAQVPESIWMPACNTN